MAHCLRFSIPRRLATSLIVFLAFGIPEFADGGSLTVSPPTENCYARNLYNSLKFKCRIPQARAFRSSEVVRGLLEEDEYIKPSMTVLHRCDERSGCCIQREGMTCAPENTEVVRLDFKIRTTLERSERLVTILARNHTACGCVEDEFIQDEEIAVRAFVFPTVDLARNNFS